MRTLFGWKHTREAIVVLAALALYAAGVKFLLLPAIIWLNARYVPMPRIFTSWFSRLFVAVLVTAVLVQISATFQFLLFPQSNFVALAVILVVLQAALWKFMPVQPPASWKSLRLFDAKDAAALVVALLFLLPFVPPLVRDPINSLAQIGGLQAIDSTNHYAGIAEVAQAEHLTYAPNYYYPKGFHITVGFIENTVFPSQSSLGWQGNVVLFFVHYAVMAVMLAYAAYYAAAALMGMMKYKLETFGSHFLLAMTLGIPLVMFYLLPMVNEGFLNYYYVITTVIVGLLYLFDIRSQQAGDKDDWRKLLSDDNLRWGVVAYLLLAYGASVSWPLLIPPLLIVVALFVVPPHGKLWDVLKVMLGRRGWVIVLALALHLIPIYFQLHYASSDGSQGGLNSTGGLKEYHPFVLLAGAAILVALVWGQRLSDNVKRLLLSVYVPLLLFVVLLVAVQYFKVGEVRYYAIKTSILLEILLLILAVVALLDVHRRRGALGATYTWLVCLLPVTALVLLVNTAPNPFRDIRELLRPYSGHAKPIFFEDDARAYIQLGMSDRIAHFNSTTLHYNQEQGKFFNHSQLPFWANMMQYDASEADFQALHCNGALYSNLAFGTFSDAEQEALVAQVKKCALMARDHGQVYYLVTDKDSLQKLRDTFGDSVTYVY